MAVFLIFAWPIDAKTALSISALCSCVTGAHQGWPGPQIDAFYSFCVGRARTRAGLPRKLMRFILFVWDGHVLGLGWPASASWTSSEGSDSGNESYYRATYRFLQYIRVRWARARAGPTRKLKHSFCVGRARTRAGLSCVSLLDVLGRVGFVEERLRERLSLELPPLLGRVLLLTLIRFKFRWI